MYIRFFFSNDSATTEIYTFPYTTLFRSERSPSVRWGRGCSGRSRLVPGQPLGIARRRSPFGARQPRRDRKSTRLNSSHVEISYAVFCLKKKTTEKIRVRPRPTSSLSTTY